MRFLMIIVFAFVLGACDDSSDKKEKTCEGGGLEGDVRYYGCNSCICEPESSIIGGWNCTVIECQDEDARNTDDFEYPENEENPDAEIDDTADVEETDNNPENPDIDNYEPLCGDLKVESPEFCDSSTTSCAELDPARYISGNAICNDECTGYDVSLCQKKEVDIESEQYFPAVDDSRSFTVSDISGDKVVTDSVTTLMWQQEILTAAILGEAVDFCNSSVYGGFDDWRIPTMSELTSLFEYKNYDPAADKNAFPEFPSEKWSFETSFFSSTEQKINAPLNICFAADFTSGTFGYGFKESLGNLTQPYLCVRNTKEITIPEKRFVESEINSELLVKDVVTNLMWQKNGDSFMTWQEAVDYCETVSYAGFNDWRLPSMHELLTLVDFKAKMPSSSFPDMLVQYFWSSTEFAGDNTWAAALIFDDIESSSLGYFRKEEVVEAVKCVRK